jgi:hypothetical protein
MKNRVPCVGELFPFWSENGQNLSNKIINSLIRLTPTFISSSKKKELFLMMSFRTKSQKFLSEFHDFWKKFKNEKPRSVRPWVFSFWSENGQNYVNKILNSLIKLTLSLFPELRKRWELIFNDNFLSSDTDSNPKWPDQIQNFCHSTETRDQNGLSEFRIFVIRRSLESKMVWPDSDFLSFDRDSSTKSSDQIRIFVIRWRLESKVVLLSLESQLPLHQVKSVNNRTLFNPKPICPTVFRRKLRHPF